MMSQFATGTLSRIVAGSLVGSIALLAACRGPEFVGDTTGTGGATTTSSTGGAGGGSAGGGGAGSGGGMPSVTVTVEVVDRDGSPVDSAPVLVSDPSGAPLGALAMTALNGKVAVVAPVDGLVSAFVTDGDAFAYSAVVTPSTSSVRIVHAFSPTNTHSPVNVAQSVDCPTCVAGDVMRWSLPCRAGSTTVTAPGTQSYNANGYVGCAGQDEHMAYVIWYSSGGVVKGIGKRGPDPFGTTNGAMGSLLTAVTPVDLITSVTNAPQNYAPTKSIRSRVATGIGFNSPVGFSAASETFHLEESLVPNLDLYISVDDIGGTVPAKVRYSRHFDPFVGATENFDAGLGLPDAGTFNGSEVTVAFTGTPGDLTQVHLESANQRWVLAAPTMTSGTIRVPTLPSSLSSYEPPGTAKVVTESLDSLGVTSYEAQLARGIAADPFDLNDPDGIRWSTDAQ